MKNFLSNFDYQILSKDEMKTVKGGQFQYICCCSSGHDFKVFASNQEEAQKATSQACGGSSGGCSGSQNPT